MKLERRFVTLPFGQIHVRTNVGQVPDGASGRRPLLMLHASPGSSRMLLPLIDQLSEQRPIIAPDTAGNGDSELFTFSDEPEIPAFADVHVQVMDRLNIPSFDVYGTHTGASLALDIANRYGDRVGRVALEGIGLYSPALRSELLERYAPVVEATSAGDQLWWTWNFVRNTYLFFPWYRTTAESRSQGGLPEDPWQLHDKTVEVLKSMRTYRYSYRAAFRFDKEAALAELAHPTLLLTGAMDVLDRFVPGLSSLAPHAGVHRSDAPTHSAYRADIAAALEAFLAAD